MIMQPIDHKHKVYQDQKQKSQNLQSRMCIYKPTYSAYKNHYHSDGNDYGYDHQGYLVSKTNSCEY